jgi:addiction module HigA family antidote
MTETAPPSPERRVADARPIRRRQPTHPGEILREDVLPELRLSVAEAARQLRVSRQRLDGILSGRAPVTAEMALRLGRFCGNGPDLWLRMQQAHDLWRAREELGTELEAIPAHRSARVGDERTSDTD